ncbi:MAG: hypothetical protein DCC71_18330 [Proteobacteria bacterium]|nr:MAG: hypothetical protein DCC71_18330 [Pseudomonadota bacterium]
MSQGTIYEVLQEDHRAVSELIQQALASTDDEERDDLIAQIAEELTAHSEAESQTFYAALREHPETQQLVDDAEREHQDVTMLLDELDQVDDEDAVEQGIRRLKQLVEHHVQEEESEIFESARTVLGEEEAREIARRFEEEKGERMGDGLAGDELADEEDFVAE